MALHFSTTEFARRRDALLAAMQRERLDALFLFQQELMFWLTGYDTFGFCFFQCLVVKADGTMALLTRSADLRQAQHTSNLSDIRIWKDGRDADPAQRPARLGAGPRAGRQAHRRRVRILRARRLELTASSKPPSPDRRNCSTPRPSSPACAP